MYERVDTGKLALAVASLNLVRELWALEQDERIGPETRTRLIPKQRQRFRELAMLAFDQATIPSFRAKRVVK